MSSWRMRHQVGRTLWRKMTSVFVNLGEENTTRAFTYKFMFAQKKLVLIPTKNIRNSLLLFNIAFKFYGLECYILKNFEDYR